eukprot:85388-Alexandrium_andersonii.AAC.1
MPSLVFPSRGHALARSPSCAALVPWLAQRARFWRIGTRDHICRLTRPRRLLAQEVATCSQVVEERTQRRSARKPPAAWSGRPRRGGRRGFGRGSGQGQGADAVRGRWVATLAWATGATCSTLLDYNFEPSHLRSVGRGLRKTVPVKL